MTNLNDYATRIYEQNKAVGWWDDPDRCLFECLQLISTEVAEATEGERKDLMDDHLPHRKMGEVELADALIRTLDLGGRLGLQYEPSLTSRQYEDTLCMVRDWSVGRLHLGINIEVCDWSTAIAQEGEASLESESCYAHTVDVIQAVAAVRGYDIITAMDEKLVYNQSRADHKRENRVKANGKRF